MSYTDLFGKKKKNQSAHQIINGVYACKGCDIVVREVNYDASEELIYWTCENGHDNKTGFSL